MLKGTLLLFMGAYHYQAIEHSGAIKKGTIEADSLHHARHLLRKKGLIPTQVTPLTGAKNRFKSKKKLSTKALSLFTRQLATLLAAGVPVEEALQGVSAQTEKEGIRQLIIELRAKVLEGYSLAQAMDEHPAAFPELYCATVAAGEQTGRVDIILEKLADYTDSQQAVKQKIQQALIYPILMVVVSFAIISFLLAYVVPKIIAVFNDSNQTLPLMTKVLIAISHFSQSYGIFFIVGGIIFWWAARQSLKNTLVKLYWHQWLLKLPLVAYLIRSLNTARYIHTFSILFAAGVNILETMRVSASMLSNEVMKNAFTQATTRVKEGTTIHRALHDTHFLDPMAEHLIASGEKSGQLVQMMLRAAHHLDNEVKRIIDTSLTLLEPLIILLMGGIVLFIVLATLLPIFSMEQLVS